MIRTNEAIIDPVGFLHADPSIVDGINPKIFEIISGPDIDVQVRTVNPEPWDVPQAVGRVISKVSPVLGPLYLKGNVYGERVGSNFVDITWFPSPNSVNSLSEDLGLKPSEDVFKVVHSKDGQDNISGPEYLAFLRRGEFPQSTGIGLFEHDRRDDHLPGIILEPLVFMQSVLQMADTVASTRSNILHERSRKSLIVGFDDTTTDITRAANRMYPLIDGRPTEDLLEDDGVKRALEFGFLRLEFFGFSHMPERLAVHLPRKDARRQLGMLLLEHWAEIKPRLEVLKRQAV